MNYEERNIIIVTLKFKNLLIRSNLCDYSDTCVHVKTVPTTTAQRAAVNNLIKK